MIRTWAHRAVIGAAPPAWASRGAPRGHPRPRERPPAAEEAIASRFISRGILSQAPAQRQAPSISLRYDLLVANITLIDSRSRKSLGGSCLSVRIEPPIDP